VAALGDGPPPWYDCDTEEELAAAHRLWPNEHGEG
jgi:hypothetical protein